MIFEDKNFYYFWKPAGIASTRWTGPSFLDSFMPDQYKPLPINVLETSLPPGVRDYFHSWLHKKQITSVSNAHAIITFLTQTFSPEQEYGLVNRLDGETAGLLYFAKTQDFYASYRQQQKAWKVSKHYLATVKGNVGWVVHHGSPDTHHIKVEWEKIVISYPLMHHRHLEDRMVMIKDPEEADKWRGKMHAPTTYCEVISYDIPSNQSLLHVTIKKWVRHQIRMHLAWCGYPIVWEKLYAKNDFSLSDLHLWSIGVELSQ